MTMKYEDALKKWGGDKLREWYPKFTMDDEVSVLFDFDEGFACCSGRDPNCYCSLAESPRAEVRIQGPGGYRNINMQDFDFMATLREIVEAGGGEVSL